VLNSLNIDSMNTESKKTTDLAALIKILSDNARVLVKKGDNLAAEKIFKKILDIAPYHAQSLQFLAAQAYEAGDLHRALALIERALENAPNLPMLHQNRALIFQQMGNQAAAIQALETALELRPEFPLALLNKAVILRDMGQRDEAVQAAIKAWKMLPAPESLANDETTPLSRRTLIKEAANLIRSTQLTMVDGELEAIAQKYGKHCLERVYLAVSVYAGVYDSGSSDVPTTASNSLIINGLSEEMIRFTRQEPWHEALQSRLSQILLIAQKAFADFDQQQRSKISMQPDAYTAQKPLIHNLPKSQNRSEMHPAIAEIFDVLPLGNDADIPTGISVIRVPPGTHVIGESRHSNWKLTVYIPLLLESQATLTTGSIITKLELHEGIMASEQINHEFHVDGPESIVLLSFAVINPELSVAETEGILAVLRAIRRFRSRYSRS
jgi:Tfp pilus assembly protein PilF